MSYAILTIQPITDEQRNNRAIGSKKLKRYIFISNQTLDTFCVSFIIFLCI